MEKTAVVPQKMLWREVLLPCVVQLSLSLLIALAAIAWGEAAAVSGMLGGLVIALPAALVALRWVWQVKRGLANGLSVLLGSAIKVFLSLALMACCVQFYAALDWLFFLVSLIIVSQAPLIVAFWVNKKG